MKRMEHLSDAELRKAATLRGLADAGDREELLETLVRVEARDLGAHAGLGVRAQWRLPGCASRGGSRAETGCATRNTWDRPRMLNFRSDGGFNVRGRPPAPRVPRVPP